MNRRILACSCVALLSVGLAASMVLIKRPPVAGTCAPESPTATPRPNGSTGTPSSPASRAFQLPHGGPVLLSCVEAHQIVEQARQHLASPPGPVDPAPFAEGVADWLDPHGLWSAAPDAPIAQILRDKRGELLHELEAPTASCPVAEALGVQVAVWVDSLRALYDEEALRARQVPPFEAWRLAAEPIFEDRGVARPGRELARELGHIAGTATLSLGDRMHPMRSYVAAARARFFPELDPVDWGRLVLAAAVRTYIPQIDPHGGWAPLDEETSLYEVDLEAAPPPRLWGQMVRTGLGLRVESGGASPLQTHDLVLEVASIETAGLSVEQDEQLALFDDTDETPRRAVVVLRVGEQVPMTLWSTPPELSPKRLEAEDGLRSERVPFGDGDILTVTIENVPDDLGELLATTLHRGKQLSRRPLRGLLLDLRGNGGGSTDGANGAIGIFLPGAPLFPMRRRDGLIEVERAPEPAEGDRYRGPVAALVDGDTASAAEMIAGALGSYRRATVIGARTYGKGCAQEYLDDDARAGILRLTTLVYALPDGAPVQRVGLAPTLMLGLGSSEERESELPHALPTWRGPDVREHGRVAEVAWPSHHGRIGPCKDEIICKSLRGLGAPRAATARGGR